MDGAGCRRWLDELSAYLDVQASDSLRAELEQHLAACPDCRVTVDTLRQTLRLVHALSRPPFSPEARQRLLRALPPDPFVHPDSP